LTLALDFGLTVAPSPRAVHLLLGARTLIFGGALFMVALELVNPAERGNFGYSTQIATWLFAISLLTSALVSGFTRSQRPAGPLLFGLLLLDQALLTGVVYVGGGPAGAATSLYGVSCLIGGIVLGVPGAIASALGGGVFYTLLTLLTGAGTLRAPRDQPERAYGLPTDEVTYHVLVNLLALILVALLVSYLAERLHRTHDDLVEAKDRAEKAERMAALGRLAAGLAHEIRNPLSAISGSVQMLRTSAIDQDDKQLCDIVLREAKRLNELVGDMLDLARPRKPALAPVQLRELLEEVVRLAATWGRSQSDVSVVLLPKTPTDSTVLADAAQLRQVIWNLVRNAVQASATGGEVRIRLSTTEAEVVVTVEDDGTGIDSSARPHIFDAYYTTRSHGTGIGLAVVKRVADDHGFALAVDSAEGAGAKFILRMPRLSSFP
jgi:two-component system, NtrC family, sensor histidine kinase HydH